MLGHLEQLTPAGAEREEVAGPQQRSAGGVQVAWTASPARHRQRPLLQGLHQAATAEDSAHGGSRAAAPLGPCGRKRSAQAQPHAEGQLPLWLKKKRRWGAQAPLKASEPSSSTIPLTISPSQQTVKGEAGTSPTASSASARASPLPGAGSARASGPPPPGHYRLCSRSPELLQAQSQARGWQHLRLELAPAQ